MRFRACPGPSKVRIQKQPVLVYGLSVPANGSVAVADMPVPGPTPGLPLNACVSVVGLACAIEVVMRSLRVAVAGPDGGRVPPLQGARPLKAE